MRRAALLVVLVLAAASLGGCAGADGQRAVELLQQADQAMAKVKTFRMSGRLWMETPVGDLALVMSGAGNAKTGAAYVTVRAPEIPEFPETTIVLRGQRAWVRAGGRWLRIEGADARSLTATYTNELARYVEAVTVSDGHVVGGEPAVKIVGVIDTQALVNSMLGQLRSVPGAAVPGMSEALGDTRIAVYLSERSHLPVRSLVDVSFEADGERVDMHMDFALTHVDEPVRIPGPGG